MRLEMFEDAVWQMSRGERAAIEGVLAQLRPALAIEIGSMEGACLRRIADHADEVHSFDLTPPSLAQPANVILHTGDSHALLAPFLAELVEQERRVDLVLVDGDHSPGGVRRDLEDLLDSRAVARTVILIHDTANERVRQGVDAVRFAAWPKVAHVELDWVPGRLFAEPALRNELWFGLGLVIVDVERPAYLTGSVYEQRYHPTGPLLAEIRDRMREREQVPPGVGSLTAQTAALTHRVAELEVQLSAARTAEARLRAEVLTLAPRLTGAERALANVTGSASWKLTQPLRGAKRRVGRRRPAG
ncbi:MAG: class I SAM-dependent methyltransferase [Solirubrobacteraceae bacterium]